MTTDRKGMSGAVGNGAYQLCRVCGDHVPAGFTNCDRCYHAPAADVGHVAAQEKESQNGWMNRV